VTVLVVACPSALLLASPSAMLASFAAAARLGILIKQPSTLEAAANVNAVVFDKTGTITTGKFQVTKLAPATGVDGAELLRAAANGEQHSNHPLAQSILVTAKRRAKIEPDGSNDYRGIRRARRAGPHQRRRDLRGPRVVAGRAESLGPSRGRAVERDRGHDRRPRDALGATSGAVGLEDTIRNNTRA
jgi:cation transport ATPase